MIVTLAGLSAMWLVRLQRRAAELQGDYAEAQLYAQAAVELGLHWISTDPDWRSRVVGTTWFADRPIGAGTCSLTAIDPIDGNVPDSPTDSVILTGIGVKGSARHKTEVTLAPESVPLEALRTCLHASGQVQVNSGKIVTVVGGPLSTNGNLRIDGTVDGNVEGATRSGGGTVTGTVTVPAAAKNLPDAGVFQTYKDLAVTIPYPGGTMEKVVLSPGSNPWGVASPDGVYYMDTGARDIIIRGIRLWGTLVIQTGGKKVTIDNAVLMQPYRADYPVLIVDGTVEISISSLQYGLSEAIWLTNFNPPGSPYEGNSDITMLGTYPNEIHGLVHVRGPLTLKASAWIRGAIICEDAASCTEANGITHNAALYTDPPMGYRTTKLRTVAGSWKRAVD